jgi:GxxExxY protein
VGSGSASELTCQPKGSARQDGTTEITENTESLVEEDKITEAIIGAAIDVHRELGPGLLESAYEACLAYELSTRGLKAIRQLQLPVVYRGMMLDCGYRIDLLVEDRVVVEVKAVERLDPIHQAQLLTYLRLSNHRVGLLINFNARTVKEGLKRMVL